MPDDRLSDQIKTSVVAASDDLRKSLGQDLDSLRAAVDERVKALESAIARTSAVFDQAVHDINEVSREERAAERERFEAARAAADAELTAARTAAEAELKAAQARQAETATALNDAHHEIEAARRAWADQSAALDEAYRRIRVFEEEHGEWTLARQVAEAHLEEERQRRKTIAVQLETVQEELQLAKAEVKSSRLESLQLRERVRRLETSGVPLESAGNATPQPSADVRGALLDHLRTALKVLSSAQTADAILVGLLESLSEHFATVSLYVAGPSGLIRWRTLGSDRPDGAQAAALPLAGDSPVARAFTDRALVTAAGTARVAAVPVLANDRAIGVAYLEHPADRSDSDVALFTKLAEVLTERVNHRLQRAPSVDRVAPDRWLGPAADTTPPPAENETGRYVLARQARRIPINDGVTVLVNGVASALVDLSTLGAQVVSPNAVYPNRAVRIVLPRDEGDLSCKARIVWARVERQQDNESVRYRAGLEFIEADKNAVQVFVSRHGAIHLAPAPTTMH
jgi:hypothetical protein